MPERLLKVLNGFCIGTHMRFEPILFGALSFVNGILYAARETSQNDLLAQIANRYGRDRWKSDLTLMRFDIYSLPNGFV